MINMNGLGAKAFALTVLALFITGCSNSSVPTAQGTSSLTQARGLPQSDPTCSQIFLHAGDNGTYHVAVGDSCEIIEPENALCSPSASGAEYNFNAPDPTGLGTWNVFGVDGTFKRTKTGKVVISVSETVTMFRVKGCVPTTINVPYGHVTLN